MVPTYRNSRPLWRWAESSVGQLRRDGSVRTNRTERLIEFPNGGFLGIYSMDNEDSIRGESFHLVVADEAAMIPETAWTDAILPTLADFGADAILISTPKGRNWFWEEWVRGQQGYDDVISFTAPSYANPNPRIQRAAYLARERVPDRTYRQEWRAEFLDDGGGVFRLRPTTFTAERQEAPIEGHAYCAGVDWGKHQDFTVITVLDLTTKREAYKERFNQIDYTLQMGRLETVWRRFRPLTIIAEQNAMGDPLIEQAQRLGMPVEPFVTSNATKKAAIEALALALERDELRLIDDPVTKAELQAYDVERLPSGLLRYGAPQGMHDDTVISLALAWQAASSPPPAMASYDRPLVGFRGRR